MKTMSGAFEVPAGFVPVAWKNASIGDEVFLCGTHNGAPRAYGPHYVVSIDGTAGLCGPGGHHVLKNRNGVMFLEYPEELLKRA